ncbi:MAG: hypothetical protein H6748_08500 [Spirochaetaceae bacterium]|nr:hypothetical protein [Spirochaetaceae bacterium]HPG26121.1 hypothetical protein [Myxococcota bacterium]
MRRGSRRSSAALFALLVASLAGTGCTTGTRTASAPARLDAAHEATLDAGRTYLAFRFPPLIGRLALIGFQEFDDPSLGAVANYRRIPEDHLIVSVYAYPAPRLEDGTFQPIAEHARDELAALVRYYEGARPIPWPPELAMRAPDGHQVHQAALEIQHPELGGFYSLLQLLDYGDARLKLRISFPPSDERVAPDVRAFLAAFPYDARPRSAIAPGEGSTGEDLDP